MAKSPTPPQPTTATDSPGLTPAVLSTAPRPVIAAQPSSESSTSGSSRGTGKTLAAGTTVHSANVVLV